MRQQVLFLGAVIACMAYGSFVFSPTVSGEVPYPEGYRNWVHVKSGVIGPKSPVFDKLGGIHHIYANPKAVKGYESGQFAEGSVLAFDKLEITEDDKGNISEGKRKWVDVMFRDHKFDSTGGWGFEEFLGDSKTERVILNLAKAKCFNCHESRKQNSFVFSVLRK